ncbi:hypothetical protein EYF80_014585 [Liparis tanakae]|uniref:Uncharacterized protein n=1 Tax=Liparis tanakae TaxID=230148 RepID=A0A4Z2ICG4_9TELE|nr:hypothetical protein EYF80_014585 [Liparis tanakae]
MALGAEAQDCSLTDVAVTPVDHREALKPQWHYHGNSGRVPIGHLCWVEIKPPPAESCFLIALVDGGLSSAAWGAVWQDSRPGPAPSHHLARRPVCRCSIPSQPPFLNPNVSGVNQNVPRVYIV